MFLAAARRWALLILLSALLWCLWPALTAVIYEPRVNDPLAEVSLGVK